MHLCSLSGTESQTCLHRSESNVEKAIMIDCWRSDKFRGLLLYTISLRYPHKKKSVGVRSGDLAGQSIAPSCIKKIDSLSNKPENIDS